MINAVMLMMAAGVISGFKIYGFSPAVFGSLLISLVSWIQTSFIMATY